MTDPLAPLHVFRFRVEFTEAPLAGGGSTEVVLCRGAFSEVSGLEVSLAPTEIREGGNNYGAAQRVGPVSFSTVVLKRGMTTDRHLWHWFYSVANGSYTHRLDVRITLEDTAGTPIIGWTLDRCLPVRLRAADLSASNNEVGIEELHLVHEGLREVSVSGGAP